jgi:hypothetical protein
MRPSLRRIHRVHSFGRRCRRADIGVPRTSLWVVGRGGRGPEASPTGRGRGVGPEGSRPAPPARPPGVRARHPRERPCEASTPVGLPDPRAVPPDRTPRPRPGRTRLDISGHHEPSFKDPNNPYMPIRHQMSLRHIRPRHFRRRSAESRIRLAAGCARSRRVRETHASDRFGTSRPPTDRRRREAKDCRAASKGDLRRTPGRGEAGVTRQPHTLCRVVARPTGRAST